MSHPIEPQGGSNPFLNAPVWRVFLSTAVPMAIVLSMSGVLNLVDGIFVGRFVGPEALAAVSLAFPAVMVMTALSTLVGGGMASLMARALGAGETSLARSTFVRAHGLALAVSAAFIAGGLVIGPALIRDLAAGNAGVEAMTRSYLLVLLIGLPVRLVLGLHADALRTEGRASLIAVLSMLLNLCNMAANWLLIVVLDFGVTGSALGTVASEAIGLALLVAIRLRGSREVPMRSLRQCNWWSGWREILVLGLPLCLGFIGLAVVSISVLGALRFLDGSDTGALVAAYGVVTRILGLAFLPQMAFALTAQTITGHNAGAGQTDRVRAGQTLSCAVAFLWCLAVTLVLLVARGPVAEMFSTDPAIIAGVGSILQPMMVFYPFAGPILVLALYYQALGQPGRTALLTLLKPWLLTPLLVLGAAHRLRSDGLWLAFPLADGILLALGAALLVRAGHTGRPANIAEEAR